MADDDVETMNDLEAALADNRSRLTVFLRARCRGGVDGPELDDAMQELWLRCRSVDSAGILDAKSYLFRMAHNLASDRARRLIKGRRYEAEWAYVHERLDDSEEAPTVERSLIARDQLRKLDRSLRAVGERAAWIFRRYRLDGMSQKDIAVELGVSLSTVEKDLRKAYGTLVASRERAEDE